MKYIFAAVLVIPHFYLNRFGDFYQCFVVQDITTRQAKVLYLQVDTDYLPHGDTLVFNSYNWETLKDTTLNK